MKKIIVGLVTIVMMVVLAVVGANYYQQAKADALMDAAWEVERELDGEQVDFCEVLYVVHENYKGAYELDGRMIELPNHYLFTFTIECVVPGHEEVVWHREGLVNYKDNMELVDEINNEYANVLIQMRDSVEKNGWA